MDYAMAQGPHRLARGQWYFKHCTDCAKSFGVSLGWTLTVVGDAGHVSQQIYDEGAGLLRDRSEL
jgi:hypothetical protein